METKQFDKTYFLHINFAHRGLHDLKNGIPENSLAAFKAASEKGYGAEMDVQLSKDGQVVVFHDDTLERVCGVKGSVADYDYNDLHKMSLCGTGETISLFTDVLKTFYRPGCGPLLVELKTGKRNRELCEKTRALLKGYPGVFCIESFNPFIVLWFKKNAPEIFRGQLAEGPGGYPKTIPRFVAHLLSYCWMNFLNRPDFIAYEICQRPKRILKLREKGLLLFAWTSRKPGENEADNDAVIFENYRPPVSYGEPVNCNGLQEMNESTVIVPDERIGIMRKDFNWFLNNYDDLYKQYGHKFLVIKNKQVLGAYDSVRQALDNTNEELGTFIVQECNGNASAYTNYISPIVYVEV